MKKRTIIGITAIAVLSAAVLLAQDIQVWITAAAGAKPALAVVDFRGSGEAQPLMSAFNSTLYNDLQSSALFDLRPKSMFPLNNPQQPSDLAAKPGAGYALKDWAGAPVNASHLVFGYTAVQNGLLVLYGYVYDTRQQNIQSAQMLFERLPDSVDEAGAIRIAHKFASDIITKFGGASLLGTESISPPIAAAAVSSGRNSG